MAKMGNIFSVKANNLVVYECRGIACVRTKPQSVRQSKATKQSASLFGKASTIGKCIRAELKPLLAKPIDKDIQNKLCILLLKLLKNEAFDNSSLLLELNNKAELSKLLKTHITMYRVDEDTIIVSVPDINPINQIKAPEQTAFVECTFTVVVGDINNPTNTNILTVVETIPYKNETITAHNIQMPVTNNPQNILLLAVSLKYATVVGNYFNSPNWRPIGIVNIIQV